MSIRALARHRSAASNAKVTALSASVATGARRYRRRSAVIAASSGLVVTMGLPAAAVAAPQVDEVAAVPAVPAAPVETTTGAVSVDSTARVELALGEMASVDSSVAEQAEQAAAAAAAAAAAQAEADRVAAEQVARTSATSTALAARGAAVQSSRSTDRTVGAAVADVAATAVVAAAPAGSGVGARALAAAQQYAGVPYVWGGSTPSGFDCSGLLQHVFRQVGVSLPRVAVDQASAGRRVSASEAQPGDLVAFSGGGGVSHIGIYAGNGQMFDAPRPGKSVGLHNVWSSSVYFVRIG